MKKVGTAVGLPLITLGLLAGLAAVRPFGCANNVLDRLFHGAPAWTQVNNLYRDPGMEDQSRGEDTAHSLDTLAAAWRERPPAKRVYFMGNSQMHSLSLGPGERPLDEPEHLYFYQIAEALHGRPDAAQVGLYRMSWPALSYAEALFTLNALACRPELKPDRVVLQVNYQSFRQAGIREGVLDMLADPCLRGRVEALSRQPRAYADAFADALRRYADRKRRAAAGASPASAGTTGVPQDVGGLLERRARAGLEHVSTFRERLVNKDDLLDMLYRLRLYVLQVKPSTARPLLGGAWQQNQEALEAIAELCQDQHVDLALFNAPLNPKVKLERTPEDRRIYDDMLRSYATRHHLRIVDIERAVPAELWGKQYNVPDPMHLSRAGHRETARLLLQSGIVLGAPDQGGESGQKSVPVIAP